MNSHKEISVREYVWLEAWVNTARSDSCINLSTPALFADQCLADFDKRFASLHSYEPIKEGNTNPWKVT